jgi:hypothetical protein
MTDRELMQEALEAMLSAINAGDWKVDGACDPHATIIRLTNRLAQPEPEPVAWGNKKGEFKVHQEADDAFKSTAIPFYTAPPKRKWVGLTDGDMVDLLKECEGRLWLDGFRAIEAKLKEKNA